jgi:hypothetical protein
MITRPLFLGFLLTASLLAEEIPRAVEIVQPPQPLINENLERVISSTQQFRITGGDPRERAILAQLAEQTKDELLKLTEESDEWKVPVNVALHGKTGDPMPLRTTALQILFNEIGYNIRLDVHLSRGIEQERFKFATTSALIYERALRGHPSTESDTPLAVPPWLVDGLREANAWRLNQSDRRLYEALFKTGGLFKTDELFAVNDALFEEMDAAMRAAFRVSSGSLVMALLQQPQGKEGFRAFLTDVADYQGEMPSLLRKHFPELNLSETSLSKWWALQLANIGARNLATDVLSISQTETALAEGLRLNLRTPEGIIEPKELSAWPEIAALPEPERINAVKPAAEALFRLSFRCFPSFRPILAEYQLVLDNLAKNKTEALPTQLAALAERRATMSAKAIQARDYMDYFEITRARETSGAFDDYMRLKDRLKSNPHRRTDDLSKYLDRMDAIFSRKGTPSPQAPFSLPESTIVPDLPQP